MTTVTNPAYWDCECEKNYIRPKSKPKCDICNACEDDQPDSRANEVAAALADVKLQRQEEKKHGTDTSSKKHSKLS